MIDLRTSSPATVLDAGSAPGHWRDRLRRDAGAEAPPFSYEEAFNRNIGWLTEWEQQALRHKTIAIAGMGGVGGVHLLTLARLGVGRFHIADFDRFELGNFNRQVGATHSTLGRLKTEVLAEMATDINPEVAIKPFTAGVTAANLDAFLDGVDLFVDGLDFFVLDVRAQVFARCAERGIPAITAAPIGMGAAYLVFMPGRMTFEQYFRLSGRPRSEQIIRFLVGLTPRAFQRSYLMDPTRVSLAREQGPSTSIACQLCAGVASAEALKILLGRGPVRAAPHYHQFDAYRTKLIIGWLPGGAYNPLQIARRAVARRMAGRLAPAADAAADVQPCSVVEQILDIARWTPSGDNTQPWRFAIQGGDRVRIDIARADQANVYEFDHGRPTVLSAGFLLESLRIAASRFGHAMHWQVAQSDSGPLALDVSFVADPVLREDPLFAALRTRSVDRRRYRLTRLLPEQKAALAATLGEGLALRWFESAGERWQITRLNARATDIRLRIPEAFAIHRDILDWSRDFSETGIPVRAVGMNSLSIIAMQWLMRSWPAMNFANRYLGTTLLSRLELDLVPGLSCAAHFAVTQTSASPADPVRRALLNGQALQRFWLTAAALGLVMQPSLATLCFAYYGARGERFTADPAVLEKAKQLASKFTQLIPEGPDGTVFIGRIGAPASRQIRARSVRRPLSSLVIERT